MSNQENRKQIKRSVSISDEELKIINTLLSKGVKVTAQMTPEEPESEISIFLKGM